MRNKYSRRELQGWGALKQPLVRNTLSITNVDIMPEVAEKFAPQVEKLVATVMDGLGFKGKAELADSIIADTAIADMYDDLEKNGLRYISSVYNESDSKE